jgi:hypothetical protein
MRQEMHREIWWAHLLENGFFVDREGDGEMGCKGGSGLGLA